MVLLSSLLQNISCFLSDCLDLTLIGITSLSELFSLFLSESIHKYSHHKTILSLNIYKDINQCVPFSNELTYLVSSHIQSMETGSTELAFNIFNLQFDFSPEHVITLCLEITQSGFNHSAFNDFSTDSGSNGLSHTCLAK